LEVVVLGLEQVEVLVDTKLLMELQVVIQAR
jgi:hypothetical protein